MPKGYWKFPGLFLKVLVELWGNAQITPISQSERWLTCPAAISKNVAISILFLQSAAFLVLHLLKVKRAVENLTNAQQFFSYVCTSQPCYF
jgi:hypothetical protein